MDDARFGRSARAVRIRRGWRQVDLAAASGLSAGTVSLIERGHVGRVTLSAVRAVAAALDGAADVTFRWNGGDLDGLINARHSALHETVARSFARMPAWAYAPEVSFSIYGERGVVDGLAWHAARSALPVIELKSEIVDVNELLGTLDRKRRLARQIARERGWNASSVSAWLAVADTRTNRRPVDAHGVLLRSVFIRDPIRLREYLRDPVRPLAVLTLLTVRN